MRSFAVMGSGVGRMPAWWAMMPSSCWGVWVARSTCMSRLLSRLERRCPAVLQSRGMWRKVGGVYPRSCER